MGAIWASEKHHPRTFRCEQRFRRLCGCGSGQRAMFIGSANGVALMRACEWCVRMWVRDPDEYHRMRVAADRAAGGRGGYSGDEPE